MRLLLLKILFYNLKNNNFYYMMYMYIIYLFLCIVSFSLHI